jgi:hypothetical protein
MLLKEKETLLAQINHDLAQISITSTEFTRIPYSTN